VQNNSARVTPAAVAAVAAAAPTEELALLLLYQERKEIKCDSLRVRDALTPRSN
jgi:hypothetical protein